MSIVELTLSPSRDVPRFLHLRRNAELFTAALYPDAAQLVMLAFATAPLAQCYLCLSILRAALWLGHAAFDVSDEDAARIQATFPEITVEQARAAEAAA